MPCIDDMQCHPSPTSFNMEQNVKTTDTLVCADKIFGATKRVKNHKHVLDWRI
jgi:hypothetical protein